MAKTNTNKKLAEGGIVAADSAPVAPDAGEHEEIVSPEKREAENRLILEAAAHQFTSIINGDKALYQGKGVEKIVVYLRGE